MEQTHILSSAAELLDFIHSRMAGVTEEEALDALRSEERPETFGAGSVSTDTFYFGQERWERGASVLTRTA
jgi:hypothetical protein